MSVMPKRAATDPSEFDLDWYRKTNADLAEFSDQAIADHYDTNGRAEGRVTSPLALRENYINLVHREESILEIGPFCNPAIIGENVKYFEVLDQDALIARAHACNYDIRQVPNIDYMSPIGDLSIVDRHFDACFSSHVIEHQPDLVRHLRQVTRILKPGGAYYLIVPDRRYCFDHFNVESSLARVLDAFYQKKTTHDLQSVIEHRVLVTHNDPHRHWDGDHEDQLDSKVLEERLLYALSEHEAAAGGYIDVHAWQFTPDSLQAIIKALAQLGYISLRAEKIFGTPQGRFEFTAILRKV